MLQVWKTVENHRKEDFSLSKNNGENPNWRWKSFECWNVLAYRSGNSAVLVLQKTKKNEILVILIFRRLFMSLVLLYVYFHSASYAFSFLCSKKSAVSLIYGAGWEPVMTSRIDSLFQGVFKLFMAINFGYEVGLLIFPCWRFFVIIFSVVLLRFEEISVFILNKIFFSILIRSGN